MENFDKSKIWHDVLESLRVSVSSAIFSTWFSQTHLVSIKKFQERAIVEIGCNSSYVKTTIETRYFGLVQEALTKTLDVPCDLLFVVKEDPTKKGPGAAFSTPLFETEKSLPGEILAAVLEKTRIRSNLTFENFAVSSSNQMAWAATEAVSKNPGTAYNPLFIWGGVGVGKTHLMNAVAYEILKKNGDAKVLLCTSEGFTNDIVAGIRNKTTQNFRDKYRKLSILLIDDIQFIAGKDAVQEEFFHTFNAVTSSGGQVILTSDRPPHEISKLEERLKSRFEAGLIVDVAPADFELRCAILQIKSKEKGVELPMELVQLIAANIDSARKIEGFLIRLMSEARIKNTEITSELIESLIGRGGKIDGQTVKATPNDVVVVVCDYFSVGKRSLLGTSRVRSIARPRQILMYFLRTLLGLPLEEVGHLIGGRDHTTVMHAVNKITHLATTSVDIREDLVRIKQKL